MNTPFDPGNKYSVCKNWGSTGWIYDKTVITREITSWADFIDVASNEASGKTSILDTAPNLCGMYFWANGKDWNTTDEADLKACEDFLVGEFAQHVKAFDSYPHQLSGGQRQRAMIAQSISCDPKLLIADEPTTALDVTVQAEILDLLRSLNEKLGTGIILITHDMGVVADMADHVIVMKGGHVVETGTATQIYRSPREKYTQELLAAVPHLGMGASTGKKADPHKGETPVLSMRGVDIVYPKHGRVAAFRAAEDINLDIFPGEVVGLVGESGSGKTTIGRAVVGLLKVATGEITVAGQNMVGVSAADLQAVRRNIGIVFQDPGSSLNPRWPIGDSIAEPLVLAGKSKDDIETRILELLEMVELPTNYRNRYPHELSGGQHQRVGIARALALNPKILVADEPTSALDVSVQARVLAILQQIQKVQKFAILFISHDLAVVDLLSDRIAVMNHGKIVEQGSTDQILRNPQHPYTQRLIAAVPVPDPEEQRKRRRSRTT